MKEETFTSQLSWILTSKILYRLLSSAATIAMIFLLSTQEYGLYSFALYWSLVIVLIATIGLNDYIVYQLSSIVSASKNGEKTKTELSHSIIDAFLLATVLGVLSSVAVLYLSDEIAGPAVWWPLFYMCLSAILAAYIEIIHAVLRVLGKMHIQAKLTFFMAFAILMLYPLVAFYTHSALYISLTYFLASLLFVVVHVLYCYNTNLFYSIRISFKLSFAMLGNTWKFGGSAILIMLLPILITSLAVNSLGVAEAAPFNLFIGIYLAGNTITMVLDQVMYPRYMLSLDNSKLIFLQHFGLSTIFYVAVLVFTIVFGKAVAEIALPEQFHEVIELFPLLAIAWLARAWSQVGVLYHKAWNSVWFCLVAYGTACCLIVLPLSTRFPVWQTLTLWDFAALLILLEVAIVVFLYLAAWFSASRLRLKRGSDLKTG